MKRVFCLCLVLAIMSLVVASFFAVNASFGLSFIGQSDSVIEKSLNEAEKYEEKQPIDPSDEKYIEEGDKRLLLNDNPEAIFRENKTLTQYYDIDEVIDQAYLDSVGATIRVKEVMPYCDYCKRFHDEGELTSIDDNRLVWVLQIYFPGKYETKRQTFQNALVTGLYDAETGFYFGYTLTGDKVED